MGRVRRQEEAEDIAPLLPLFVSPRVCRCAAVQSGVHDGQCTASFTGALRCIRRAAQSADGFCSVMWHCTAV